MQTAQAQAIPEAVLEVVEPDGTRRVVRVTHTPFTIGRGAEAGNDLQLADKRISRHSALLVYTDGAFRLEDRGQRHGLFINGKKSAWGNSATATSSPAAPLPTRSN